MKGQFRGAHWILAVVIAAALAIALPATANAQTSEATRAVKRDKHKTEEAAPSGPEFSKEFRKEASKVQKLVNDKKWPEVLAALPALDALPALSPEEMKVIATWRLQATQASGDTDAFAAAIEHYLEKGYAVSEQIGPMHQQLAAYYNGKQDRPRTIEHYRAFIDVTPDADASEMQTLGRLYLQSSNYQEAANWLGRAADYAAGHGQRPDELWLQLRDKCFVELKDPAARLGNLEALVGYYPGKAYYTRIAAIYQSESKDDRMVMLNVYRLAVTDPQGGLETVGGYLNYADAALTAGSPGEAARALERGMKEGIVPDAGSNQAMLQEAKDAVASDHRSLPGESAAAEKNPKGEVAVKVGLGYYSTGEFGKTVEMVRRGLEKGGVGRLDDANLLLGAALMELGRRDEAKAAFQSAATVAGANRYLARIAGLWLVRAARQDAAAPGG